MPANKILVPVDFSPQSQAAVEYACAFAKDGNAELLIVHVMDPAVGQLEGIAPVEAMEGLNNALHGVKPNDETVVCSYRMLEGAPADTILKTASDENVEMIVMGTHGRTGFQRLVLGSVAESVVRKARCPVLTLRQPSGSVEQDPATASS